MQMINQLMPMTMTMNECHAFDAVSATIKGNNQK